MSNKVHGNQTIVYASNSPLLNTNGLFVTLAGITHPSPEYYIPRTERSGIFWGGIYVFEYVLSGKGYIEYEGRVHEVGKGDFIFINALTNIVYYSDKEDPYEKIWVNFTGQYISSLVKGLSLNAPFYIMPHDMNKEMSNIHRYLSKINVENRDYSMDKIAHELCGMFLALNRYEKKKEQTISQKTTTAQKIKDYIDRLAVPNVNLDDLASAFLLEKGYIIHRFTAKYGISPYKYINQRKIEAARGLLAENEMKISEIASLLGYSGTQHFSSAFKKSTGKTPTEFSAEYK